MICTSDCGPITGGNGPSPGGRLGNPEVKGPGRPRLIGGVIGPIILGVGKEGG